MAEYFYNKTSKKIVSIPDEWSAELKQAQRQMLLSNTFKPVVGTIEKTELPFDVVHMSFAESEDGESFLAIASHKYPKLRMSQEKLLAHPDIVPRIQNLMEVLQADSLLVDWWLNDMTYMRNSPVAMKAMEAFGLTQNQMEQIVLGCRE